ncbi:MAG: HAD-IC family P-type ATPase [Patescibacteria group bacterium]
MTSYAPSARGFLQRIALKAVSHCRRLWNSNGSEHPLARAIVEANFSKKLPATDFRNLAGRGARAKVGGEIVIVGSPRLMREENVSLGDLESRVVDFESVGRTAVVVSRGGAALGIIAIADTLKPDAKAAVSELKRQGVHVVMLTGDNKLTAEAIAKEVGIEEVVAEVLPADKAATVERFRAAGQRIAFVGDGVNDAPALVVADLGIALGTGTDIAIEAGNIVLVAGSPMKVVEAITLARGVFRAIGQNLFWAFAYNVAAVPLAALGLLNPMIAAGAMAFSSVSVIGNSLRLRRFAPKETRATMDMHHHQ